MQGSRLIVPGSMNASETKTCVVTIISKDKNVQYELNTIFLFHSYSAIKLTFKLDVILSNRTVYGLCLEFLRRKWYVYYQ
jgi:hypothetical protein